MLFSTYKNTGMAASLGLMLLGPQAALPAAVCMVVDVVWLIFAGKFLFPQKAEWSDAIPESITNQAGVDTLSG